jgi:hypothetical protein
MGFPTVTHRVAYLGTRQPAVGTREVGNLASDRPFVLQATLYRTACKTLTGREGLADPDPPERGGLRWEAPSTCCGSGDTVANSDNTYLIRQIVTIN